MLFIPSLLKINLNIINNKYQKTGSHRLTLRPLNKHTTLKKIDE